MQTTKQQSRAMSQIVGGKRNAAAQSSTGASPCFVCSRQNEKENKPNLNHSHRLAQSATGALPYMKALAI